MTDFDAFYEKYQGYVRMRVCVLLYYRSDLIDDTLQLVWLKVWRKLPELVYKNVEAWLWLIATNTVRDMMRHEKARGMHHCSLEGTMEYADVEAANFVHPNLMLPDPHSYIPEQLYRQELRQEAWRRSEEQEKQIILDYINNEQVDMEDVYRVRRNFKTRYKRTERRMEAVL